MPRAVYFVSVAICAAAPQAAQSQKAFVGPYAGVEGGLLEQHYFIETTTAAGTTGRYYRSHGFGGGLFAGHDFDLGKEWRAGIEASVTAGGVDNAARFANGTELRIGQRFGFRMTARAGATSHDDKLFVYVLGGYGGNAYRIKSNTAGVTGIRSWGSSFVVGTGTEFRVSNRVGVRLELKHVDNESNQIFVGIPIRF